MRARSRIRSKLGRNRQYLHIGTQMTRGFVSGEREFDLWLGLDGRQDGLNALQNTHRHGGGQTIL